MDVAALPISRSLGVIGGAGPLVAARFHEILLRHYQAITAARADDEFPGITVLNQALAGVNETGVSDPGLAQDALSRQVTVLRQLGSQAWILACASLHSLPSATEPDCVPWLLDAASSLAAQGYTRIGIVGSRSSRQDGVFDQACLRQCLEPVRLTDQSQQLADRLIAQGMTGGYRPADRDLVRAIEQDLAPRCDLIWWGCTELSFLPASWLSSPSLLSLDAMVQSALSHLLPRP